jgi:hypothetical protein
LGTDIRELSAVLEERNKFKSANAWAAHAQKALEKVMNKNPLPSKDQIVDWLTDGRQTGALQKALTLPMLAGTRKDLLDPLRMLGFPGGETPELHHIFPRAWCSANSKSANLVNLLDESKGGRNWVESTANLMPLSRTSNNLWKAKEPCTILAEQEAHFSTVKGAASKVFIDSEAFELLRSGPSHIEAFWKRRADLIAGDLLGRTTVTL